MANKKSRKSHFWSSLSQLFSDLVKSAKGWILRHFVPQNDEITSEQITQKNTVRNPPKFSNKKRLPTRSLFLKFGPGGIRTHDQRIMSPLRYRCATGPSLWHNLYYCHCHLVCATFLSSEDN